MKDKKDKEKKMLLFLIVAIATSILIAVGATYAFFSTTLSSENGAVNFASLKLDIDLSDDVSLIKDNIIPSIEEYVDIATKNRVDSDGNFLKPYEDTNTGEFITAKTACIDDNLRDICSIYSFTVYNKMVDTELPIVITLNPSYNSFENLYFKVLDNNKNEVIGATHLVDSRYELDEKGNYKKDSAGNLIRKSGTENDPMPSITLTNLSQTLAKATDSETPTAVTYSIVLWVMEVNADQTKEDSGKKFSGGITVTAAGNGNNGITGIISAYGTE